MTIRAHTRWFEKIKKLSILSVALAVGFIVLMYLYLFLMQRTVIIESLESKNAEQIPVLNRIALVTAADGDSWMMQQTHDEKANYQDIQAFNQGMRINIKIKKINGNAPSLAVFQELEPGFLNHKGQEAEYSVACGICHSNGPRLIRPNLESTRAPLQLLDRLTLAVWNLHIKTYGPIAAESLRGQNFKKGLWQPGKFWNEKINLPSCTPCHNNSSAAEAGFFTVPTFLRRQALTRQNFMSIRFLLDLGVMPPPLHAMSEGDKKKIAVILPKF